jgi:hypothetical protein
LLGLFFSFRGFTRRCCCGGSRDCWIGLVIDWIKFVSANSRAVWPPSSSKGGEVSYNVHARVGTRSSSEAMMGTRSVDAWCTRNSGKNDTSST